jgi:thiol-disulfide isomerase/thioredoxin
MKPFNFRIRIIQLVLIILVFLIPSLQGNAQLNEIEGKKYLGDSAPELKIAEWLKGKAIDSLKRGTIYVIDFWAPYCKGCIDAMPLHSKLAKKYKENVAFIGVYVYPHKSFTLERTKVFIDSLGRKVRYPLAVQEDRAMEVEWLEAFDAARMPNTFIVNKEGKVAWIGYPTEVGGVLQKILNQSWDIEAERIATAFNKKINEQDYEAELILQKFWQKGSSSDFFGEPDSSLNLIKNIVLGDPMMEYAPRIVFHKFSSLLKLNMSEALVYAQKVVSEQNPLEPAYFSIIGGIMSFQDKLSIPAELYQIGAESMIAYSEKSPKNLLKIGEWYWRAGDKRKAIQYHKKAIKEMKKRKAYGMGWFF